MKRSPLLVAACACVVSLVFAGGTAASSRGPVITIKLGDQIDVLGTRVLCLAQVGKNLFKGKKLVSCYKLSGSSAQIGAYAPALAADGEIGVAKLTKSGGTLVFRRKPAGLGAANKVIRAKIGDTLALQGTDVACAVSKAATGAPYLSCFTVSASGGKTGSYSFSISDAVVAVTQFTAPNKTKLIKTWKQPA